MPNSFRELKFGIVKCASRSSQDIFNELKTLLYILLKINKIIINKNNFINYNKNKMNVKIFRLIKFNFNEIFVHKTD